VIINESIASTLSLRKKQSSPSLAQQYASS